MLKIRKLRKNGAVPKKNVFFNILSISNTTGKFKQICSATGWKTKIPR